MISNWLSRASLKANLKMIEKTKTEQHNNNNTPKLKYNENYFKLPCLTLSTRAASNYRVDILLLVVRKACFCFCCDGLFVLAALVVVVTFTM